jgi:hypothetical protein
MQSLTTTSKGTKWRLLRRLLPISFAIGLTLTFGTADAFAKAEANVPSPVAAETAAARTRAEVQSALPVAIDDDLYEYAQREAKSMALQDFEGGEFIVIGASGLALVLLIVLLILLV